MVAGVPMTFPSAATTAAARWPAFTSTATTGCRLSSSSGGTGAGGGCPARIEVPAPGGGVAGDVVADGAGSGLGGDLVTPVGELHRAGQLVAAVRPVGQVRQRGGQLNLQPLLAGVPTYGFVSPVLVRLAVGGQEQAGCLPLRPPLVLGHPGGGEVVPLAQQRLPAPHHRHRSRLLPPVRPGKPAAQRLEPDGLGVPLGRGGIPAHPARLPAGRDGQPRLDPADAGVQAGLLGAQVPLGLAPLVFAGAGDRPGPPRRRLGRQRPLARRAGDGFPFASRRPSAHRAARSRPASDPRCLPAARSTASSCGDRRSRVRTRAPVGAAATNGAATGRIPLTRRHPARPLARPDP